MNKVLTINLPEELVTKLHNLKGATGISVSKIIKTIVEPVLNAEKITVNISDTGIVINSDGIKNNEKLIPRVGDAFAVQKQGGFCDHAEKKDTEEVDWDHPDNWEDCDEYKGD